MKPPPKLPGPLRLEASKRAATLVVGGLVIGLVFWRLQFSTDSICCGDFDGYYHIMWSRMLWESIRGHHLPPTFTWLPLTSLNPTDYVDHHLLFHIFQIPFTWFGDLRLGAKVSATIFASLAVFLCYWLLIRYRTKYVFVWLLALLACSTPFLYRMNMAKAPPFAVIYLIIGIYLMFSRKYWLLVPLSTVFALTYDMVIILVLAVFIWVAVTAWSERRLEWRPVVWVLLGTAAGFIINPYFPHNLHLFYEHLKVKMTASDFSTKVGQEWYPYDSWEFLGNSVVACGAMVAGYIAFDPAEKERSRQPLFFLIFSTALMIMTARWKRIAEYWPPFAVIFAAFALQPWIDGARSSLTRLPTDILDELQPFLDRDEPAEAKEVSKQRELVRTAAASLLALVLGGVLAFNLYAAAKDIGSSDPPDYYRAGMQWIRTNVPAGQLVFNTDWDDFPRLVYFDPTHSYVSGLDPAYLFDKNPELSRLYERITLGDQGDPGPLIRDRFGARYVFTDNEHEKFYENAVESGWFEVVYEDSQCTVLHVLDHKRELPAAESDERSGEGGSTQQKNGRTKIKNSKVEP